MNDLQTAIDQYLDKGFGSMNKNDFEVWIFYFLLQNQLKGKSNFDISIELRVPESKVKRLRYEAILKYGEPQNTEYYVDAFEKLLSHVYLKNDGEYIQFVIEDLQLRKFLDSVLKKDGRFSNTSFNTEIVSIDADDLEYLLKTLWPKEDFDAICNQAKKKKKKNQLTFKELIKEFAIKSANETGKVFVNLTFAAIRTLLGL